MLESKDRTIEIAFGRGTLPVSLPVAADPTVIRKSALPKLPNASAALHQAFEAPIGGDESPSEPGRFVDGMVEADGAPVFVPTPPKPP